ncbi:MAG: N-acetyltransferase [Armatimonadetes bacterium]|nr:N-acetyltransferase [Armatimonadota bacterium]
MDSPIRLATEADADAINDVYNYYVHHSTCTFHLEPVTREERVEWLNGHSEKHPVLVYEVDGKVVGWASLSVHRPRPAYGNTVETSVYIDHRFHGRGIGKALLGELIRLANMHGHHTMLGGMEASQIASIRLHESLGFEKVAHYREIGYKFGQWLDTVFYQLML